MTRQHPRSTPTVTLFPYTSLVRAPGTIPHAVGARDRPAPRLRLRHAAVAPRPGSAPSRAGRSEEHTSELQSLMRTSYAVFCLKKKQKQYTELNHKRKLITPPQQPHYSAT